MKYKLIHSIYLILSLLIVWACSDNNGFLPTPDVDEPGIPLDTAYVSLAIDLTDYPVTRAYEGETAGTSAEDFVRQVRIVLFDGDNTNSKVVKHFDFDIQTNTSGTGAWIDNSQEGKDLAGTTNPNDKSQFITYARKVPATDLKMLVIVNIPSALKDLTEEGCMYGPLTNAVKIESGTAKSENVGGLAQNNYFLMTSGPGLITVPQSKLKETIREAHNDPISATVSRVVSKVTLVSSDGGESLLPATPNASVTDVQWELDITNRSTYWTIHGQADGNRENWYWSDPNYSGYGSKPMSELKNDFFYFALAGDPYPTLKKRLKQSEYCLENTMDETDQYSMNVITRALIRCTYKPANVKTAGEGFYVYNGSTYSIDEMKAFAREVSQLPGSLLTGFYKAIQEAASEEGYSFLTGKPIKNNQEVTEPFTTKGITYYYKGINYYAVKIRHRGNDDSTTPGYAHYGVLRNTHYTIKIDRIQGPGSPGILWDDIATRSTDTEDMLYNNIESSIIHQ